MPAPYMYEPAFILQTYKAILRYDVVIVSTEQLNDKEFVDLVSPAADPSTQTYYHRIMAGNGFVAKDYLSRS
jgi:hypothetical protein